MVPMTTLDGEEICDSCFGRGVHRRCKVCGTHTGTHWYDHCPPMDEKACTKCGGTGRPMSVENAVVHRRGDMELWEGGPITDSERRVTDPKPRYPEIGTGVVVRSAQNPDSFWVGRRMGSHASGQLSLPGGAMDAEDASPIKAAEREIWEEMGISARDWAPIRFWTWDTFPDTHRRFVVVYFECLTEWIPKLTEPNKCAGWELRKWKGDLEHMPPSELFSGLWQLGIRGLL